MENAPFVAPEFNGLSCAGAGAGAGAGPHSLTPSG